MSDKFYINQSTTIKLRTDKDISGATVREMRYKKPDGSEGFWVGTVEDGGTLVYNTDADDIDQPGTWIFYPHIEKGANVWNGEPCKQKFLNVGE